MNKRNNRGFKKASNFFSKRNESNLVAFRAKESKLVFNSVNKTNPVTVKKAKEKERILLNFPIY